MGQFHAYVLFVALAFLASCSGDREQEDDQRTRGDHVWRGQVQAYDKAREIEGVLKKAVEKNKNDLEKQSQ